MFPRLSLGTFAFLAATLLAGCHIETHTGDDMCSAADKADAALTCTAFCNHLFGCGNITPGKYESCLSGCQEKFVADPKPTKKACECVIQAECKAQTGYDCGDAPFPGASSGSSGSGGTSAGDAGGSTGSGSG